MIKSCSIQESQKKRSASMAQNLDQWRKSEFVRNEPAKPATLMQRHILPLD
jgi:hypothetical protein